MKEKYYLIKSFKTNKIYYVNYLKDEENEIIFLTEYDINVLLSLSILTI